MNRPKMPQDAFEGINPRSRTKKSICTLFLRKCMLVASGVEPPVLSPQEESWPN